MSLYKLRVITLALLVLVVSGSVGQPGPAYGQQESAGGKGSSTLSPAEQKLLRSLSGLPRSADAFWGHVASSLAQPFAENVEKGRGSEDVEVYKNAAPATVYILTDTGLGSGSIINEKGEVLTNYHVIEGAAAITVVLKPAGKAVVVMKENAYAADPIKTDKTADLALLQMRTPPVNLPVLRFGSIEDLEVGQSIHAIGHPQGETWTYTTGIISQIRSNYEWQIDKTTRHRATVIQTQTPINPGNSGGPLLNDQAEIIGVNSFKNVKSEGLNYAVAVDSVKAFLEKPTGDAIPPPAEPSTTSGKAERYGNIVGAYIKAQQPPPDVWFVYKGGETPAYALQGMRNRLQIDVVFAATRLEQNAEQSVVYYIDSNCDGVIDLLGLDANVDDIIDKYARPGQVAELADLAPEFAQAVANRSIPYSNVKLRTRKNR